MNISEIVKSITGVRETVSSLNAKISKLQNEIAAIEQLPPHTDDIVAWIERGLDRYSQEFKQKLAWRLNERTIPALPPSYFGAQETEGMQLLSMFWGSPTYQSPASHAKIDFVDSAALGFFLAPIIKPRLPELVEEFLPHLKGGLRHADRVAKISALQAKIDTLEAQRNELLGQIEALRSA